MALGDMRAIKWKAPAPLNVYMEESHHQTGTLELLCVSETQFILLWK